MSTISKSISFDDAIQQTALDSLATHDITAPLKEWRPEVSPNNQLVLRNLESDKSYTFTKNALNQLLTKSGLSTTVGK